MSRRGKRGRADYARQLPLLLLPYLVGSAVMVALPGALSFALAFTNYDALGPPAWVGSQNFRELQLDPRAGIAVRNSLLFIAVAVPLRLFAALGLALLLQHPRRGTGFYRVAVYLPTVIPDAAYALIWLWILNPVYGPLNVLLAGLGLPAPAWLLEPDSARLAFVLVSLFQVGEGFVVLLAALKEVPPEYYETAAVAGAGPWRAFRDLTLPLIMPWLTLLMFRDVIMSFQYTFTLSLLMTGGGPYYATLFLPLLAFEEAFENLRFGTGAAVMLLMFGSTLALITTLYFLFRGQGDVDEG